MVLVEVVVFGTVEVVVLATVVVVLVEVVVFGTVDVVLVEVEVLATVVEGEGLRSAAWFELGTVAAGAVVAVPAGTGAATTTLVGLGAVEPAEPPEAAVVLVP